MRKDEHMDGHSFTLAGVGLMALGSGALWWPDQQLLCVSDLHLGKSEHVLRRSGGLLPPYETHDTLAGLTSDLDRLNARIVVCLGDSFDDPDAARALPDDQKQWITRLQAGREWVWIEGNHDPGPVDLGGTHLSDLSLDGLVFRHVAEIAIRGEISGHYHPKVQIKTRGRAVSRPAFLADTARVILPAYGTYTGGLRSDTKVLTDIMQENALAFLTGASVHALPMPR